MCRRLSMQYFFILVVILIISLLFEELFVITQLPFIDYLSTSTISTQGTPANVSTLNVTKLMLKLTKPYFFASNKQQLLLLRAYKTQRRIKEKSIKNLTKYLKRSQNKIEKKQDVIRRITNITRNQTKRIQNYELKTRDCSCLNRVYDEIFVISIGSRMDTLTKTLFQLNSENVNFTMWEGHSPNNSYSMSLWNKFKLKIEQIMDANKSNHRIYQDMEQLKPENSAYHNSMVFFLRQTQIDIIKYSLSQNYSKILLLEDDIIISNAKYINLFCKYEYKLPQWFVLNIGINQYSPGNIRTKSVNDTINLSHQLQLKYYIKDEGSMGTFGISISFKMFQILINLFDFNENDNDFESNAHFNDNDDYDFNDILNQQIDDKYNFFNLYPLDNYFRFIEGRDDIKNNCLGIYPALILPDVTKSHLRESRNQLKFMRHKLNGDPQHFSKYWDIRFNTNFTQLIQHSPSRKYLKGD